MRFLCMAYFDLSCSNEIIPAIHFYLLYILLLPFFSLRFQTDTNVIILTFKNIFICLLKMLLNQNIWQD